MQTEYNEKSIFDKILSKKEDDQTEVNSITIYTNDIEKKKDIPKKFDNENTIYRRT